EHGLRGELLLAARLQRALDLLQARGGLGDGLLGVPAVRLGVFAGGLQPGQRLAGRLQLLRGGAGAGLVVVEALLGLGRARGAARPRSCSRRCGARGPAARRRGWWPPRARARPGGCRPRGPRAATRARPRTARGARARRAPPPGVARGPRRRTPARRGARRAL